MNIDHFVADALRGAILLGAALLAARLLGRARAAVRRMVLVAGLTAALAVPLLSAIVPAWNVGTPALTQALGPPVAEPVGVEVVAAAPGGGSPSNAVSGAPPLDNGRLRWPHVLLAVWAAGALLVASRLVLGFARARGLVARGEPIGPEWAATIERAQRDTGARARVCVSSEVAAPAVTGVRSPVILLPASASAWSEGRRRLVLLHELSHVAHRDCLAHAVAQLACAVHWFDPLSWMAARRLRIEGEMAADDAVLSAGARASSYAEELMALAASAAERVASVPSGAIGMTPASDLGTRLTSILTASSKRGPLSRGARALTLAAFTVSTITLACASPDARQEAAIASSSGSQAVAPSASTISPVLQAIAEEELDLLSNEWQPQRAAILVLDPRTGEILANAGRDRGARADVATRVAQIPGSTFKAVTIAAALEERAVTPDQRFDCSRRAYSDNRGSVSDSAEHATLDVAQILEVSSNVGTSRIFDALGAERMADWVRRFHFGQAPRLAGGDAAAGSVLARTETDLSGAVLAMGQGLTASPLQIAAAYGAIANGGIYVAPTDVPSAAASGERVISPETARTLLTMLEGTVQGERGTGKAARIAGVRVAGKTGTGEAREPGDVEGRPGAKAVTYASFVGIVPADAPRYVVLVGAEVATREGAYGGAVAAPVFARVAGRALGR
jgi:beta-lactamase regulating signal transducer with metallopeptidase domain